jgi:hypothetical protein
MALSTLDANETFAELLVRYEAHPPHALALTSRRFAIAPPSSKRSQTDPEGAAASDDDNLNPDDHDGQGLLLGAELAKLATTLCGFDPESASMASDQGTMSFFLRHPDVLVVHRSRRQLRLEELAPVFSRIAYPPMKAKRRLIVIERAQRLTPHAANALLKSIEEPLASVLFVLTAPSVGHIMPTIASRCMRMHMPSNQAPLRALTQLDDTTRKVLTHLVQTIAQRSVAQLARVSSWEHAENALVPPHNLRALGQLLSQLESVARAAPAELILGSLLELVVLERQQQGTNEGQARGLAHQGTAWLVGRLRHWQRTLDYNPSTILRLTELACAAFGSEAPLRPHGPAAAAAARSPKPVHHA